MIGASIIGLGLLRALAAASVLAGMLWLVLPSRPPPEQDPAPADTRCHDESLAAPARCPHPDQIAMMPSVYSGMKQLMLCTCSRSERAGGAR